MGFSNPAKIALEESKRLFENKTLSSLLSLGVGLSDLVQRNPAARIDAVDAFAAQLLAVASDTERVHSDVFEEFKW